MISAAELEERIKASIEAKNKKKKPMERILGNMYNAKYRATHVESIRKYQAEYRAKKKAERKGFMNDERLKLFLCERFN